MQLKFKKKKRKEKVIVVILLPLKRLKQKEKHDCGALFTIIECLQSSFDILPSVSKVKGH